MCPAYLFLLAFSSLCTRRLLCHWDLFTPIGRLLCEQLGRPGVASLRHCREVLGPVDALNMAAMLIDTQWKFFSAYTTSSLLVV